MVDERWTTEDAQSVLEAAGMTGRRGRAERDSVAAQLILQSWFDELDEPSDVEQSDGEQNDVERNDVDQNDVDPDAPASANP